LLIRLLPTVTFCCSLRTSSNINDEPFATRQKLSQSAKDSMQTFCKNNQKLCTQHLEII